MVYKFIRMKLTISTGVLCIIVLFNLSEYLFASEKTGPQMSIGKMEDGISIFDLTNSGSTQWVLHGKSAQFLKDGFVDIKDVEAIFYGKDASAKDKITITSPSAQVNQTSKEVRTDQPVVISSSDMIITGKGMNGNMKDRIVHILHNVKVVLIGEQGSFLFGNFQPTENKNTKKAKGNQP